jgi:hypothetical protein
MPLRAVNMFWDVTPYNRFAETCPLNLQGPPSALKMEEDVALEHCYVSTSQRRSQWPRGLGRRSAAARLLRLWVRISPGEWFGGPG